MTSMKCLMMEHYGVIMRPYFLNEEKYGEALPEFFESDRSLSGLSWSLPRRVVPFRP